MIDLKPCPFCGRKATFNYNIEFEPNGIRCDFCHYFITYPRLSVRKGERFEECMNRMAEMWNRRDGDTE